MALKRQRSPAPLIDRLLKPARLEASILLDCNPLSLDVIRDAVFAGVRFNEGRKDRSDRRVLREAERWFRIYCNDCGGIDLAFPLCPRKLRTFSRSAKAWASFAALEILVALDHVNTARGAGRCIMCPIDNCSYADHQVNDVIDALADEILLAFDRLDYELLLVDQVIDADRFYAHLKGALDEILAKPTPQLDKLLNPPANWDDIPEDLAADAREFSRKMLAADTTRCYEVILRQWIGFCGAQATAFPAKEAQIMTWILTLFKAGLSPFTIRNKLIVLATVHRSNGWPSIYSFAVRQTLRAAFVNYRGQRRRKRPITREHRLQIAKLLRRDSNRLRAARDRAIISFGFGGALRRSEIAAACVENIYLEPEGLIYEIPRSKGDPYGEGQSVSIRAESEHDLCPVRAVAEWLRMSGITDGPIFREITVHGCLGQGALGATSVSRIVKEYAVLIGLDGRFYGGHSLRRGWATHAHKTGASMESLGRHLRHSSLNFTRGYVEGPSPGDINLTRGSGA